MSLGLRRFLLRLLRSVPSWVAAAVFASAAIAGVTNSTDHYQFTVEGTTASSLVHYMNGHAISGDQGHAYARVRPNYDLSLTTRQSGGMCRPASVNVHVTFELTLPVAASLGAMSRRTRAAWNGFAGFARNHEAHHLTSYLGCARSFVREAKRQSAPSCIELDSDIQQMLRQMQRACESKQVPFDRTQAKVLRGLSLFTMARYQSR